ncbi:MAG TPA: 30S ribosomal protein S6 [Saprospiraceae bacterium]|nr:30S ribosomal protein S6 [Saprospiraceae bacterium]
MRHYEVTFIVDPLLSSDEIKGTATNYVEHLTNQGANVTHVDEMGLRQLAYQIMKRNSGQYFSIEFSYENGSLIPNLELALQRDGRIMRFLTVALDKHGVQFNEDKRKGKVGHVREEELAKQAALEEKEQEEKEQEEKEPAETVKASTDKEPAPQDKNQDSEE